MTNLKTSIGIFFFLLSFYSYLQEKKRDSLNDLFSKQILSATIGLNYNFISGDLYHPLDTTAFPNKEPGAHIGYSNILPFSYNIVIGEKIAPDTIVIIERPDFFKINGNYGDTSIFSYFLTPEGLLDDYNSTYDSAFLYRVVSKYKNQIVTIEEYINKGSGNWQAAFYSMDGHIKAQGLLKETGKIKFAVDKITVINEPPYDIEPNGYNYHQTVKVGYWLFYDSNSLTSSRKILYTNGVEQH